MKQLDVLYAGEAMVKFSCTGLVSNSDNVTHQ